MFAITLVAVGAAVAAWLRPLPEAKSAAPSASTFSAQQVADAKSKVCAAFAKVVNATTVNAGNNLGGDPNAQCLNAVNQRQVFEIGSAYYWRTLAAEPATPGDLAAAMNRLADLYLVINLDGIVGDRNAPAHNEANEVGSAIQTLCK